MPTINHHVLRTIPFHFCALLVQHYIMLFPRISLIVPKHSPSQMKTTKKNSQSDEITANIQHSLELTLTNTGQAHLQL